MNSALDEIIDNGSYARVLKRWGLSGEAVKKSEINPPGPPKTNMEPGDVPVPCAVRAVLHR